MRARRSWFVWLSNDIDDTGETGDGDTEQRVGTNLLLFVCSSIVRQFNKHDESPSIYLFGLAVDGDGFSDERYQRRVLMLNLITPTRTFEHRTIF